MSSLLAHGFPGSTLKRRKTNEAGPSGAKRPSDEASQDVENRTLVAITPSPELGGVEGAANVAHETASL